MEKRFSRQNLLEELNTIYYRIEKDAGFDPNNGTAQLKREHMERAIEYGRYTMLRYIRNLIGE